MATSEDVAVQLFANLTDPDADAFANTTIAVVALAGTVALADGDNVFATQSESG